MSTLIALPVLLPFLGAGISLIFGRSARAQRAVSVGALAMVAIVAGILVYRADSYGPQVLHVGGWPGGLGITLVADRLSALLLLVSSVVTLCVLIYSLGQGIAEAGRETPLSVFHPTFLVLCAGVSNAFLSSDLFNLYVSFEVLLVSSYVLITLGGTGHRVRAGTTYVVVSLLSSVVFLTALAAIYASLGTVNMAQVSQRIGAIDPQVASVLQLLLLVAFGIKAAVFPMSAWLPDSYPTAPAPVTAVFAGLLTKVGVYSVIRMQTLIFDSEPVRLLLLVAAGLTMVVGILGAVVQPDIKRVLSFTLVSHIGYMLFGVALGTGSGIAGASFYVVHHITVQTSLFLLTGLIELRRGTTNLDILGGLARSAPLLAVLFFIPAMNLAGIPPFSGFIGKLALLQAGVAAGDPAALTMVGVSVLTSVLTLYAIGKVWNRAFWQPSDASVPPEVAAAEPTGRMYAASDGGSSPAGQGAGELVLWPRRVPIGVTGPAVALVGVGLLLTVLAGPLSAYTDRAATDMMARTPYITAVLGEATP